MIRESVNVAVAGLLLSGCGGAPEAADPYADLAEDSLLVRFDANPDIAADACNPNIRYAMRTTQESVLLSVNFEVVDQSISGSGLAIFDADQTGVATNTGELNMFDPYPLPCSELTVRVMEITCRKDDEDPGDPCPNPVFEGTEMFASFRGLPNY